MGRTGKRNMAAILIGTLLLGGIPIAATSTVYATEATRKKLQEAENEKKETEENLDETKEELNNLNEQKNSLQGQLHTLNEQLQEVSDNIAELERQIDEKKREIEHTKEELADAEASEAWQYECMKKRIQFIYETQDYVMMEMLFASASFSDFLNRSDYIEQLSAYDRKKLEEYTATKEMIEEVKAQLEKDIAYGRAYLADQ